MTKVEVRRLTDDDDGLVAGWFQTHGTARRVAGSSLEEPALMVFGAFTEERLVGLAWGYELVRPDGDSMVLVYDVEVDAAHRRHGIGRQLLLAFRNLADLQGHAKVWLITDVDNQAARALCESMGGAPRSNQLLYEWSTRPLPSSGELLGEQIAYYRARAPVYDDWWESRDTDPRSDEVRAAWLAERSRLEADLDEWCEGLAGASMLELAAGTGNLTRLAAHHAGGLTALDTSPETLAINADKLGALRERVEFVVADLFAWTPPTTYDAVLFGFWISHVPADHWDAFWSLVRRCLRPGGSIWFCDNADPELGWRAGVLPRPEPRFLIGDGIIDRNTGIHERALPDGRSYRVVKRFYTPEDLTRRLLAYGIDATVTTTQWAFLLGRGRAA
jgi:SAM-dependent methyltransferase/GNAT superfamily N-acetyltransferase